MEPASIDLPLCFVVSPIGAEDSDVRKTADKVLKHVISKALSGRYKIQRADEIATPGLITAQVVERLLNAPLVVADLSDRNANVYYELAIRHAAQKPVIHIIAEGQDAPFDVKDMRLISYNLKDPDSIDRAQEGIRGQADAIEKGEKCYSPIQVAQVLAESGPGDDTKMMFQTIYSAVAGLQQDLRGIKEVVQTLPSSFALGTVNDFTISRPVQLRSLAGTGEVTREQRANILKRKIQREELEEKHKRERLERTAPPKGG
jgi:hypothetical protein